jgi:hypothetical protein
MVHMVVDSPQVKWLGRYSSAGLPRLRELPFPDRVHRKYQPVTDELRKALFATLHAPPREYGLNRTTWCIPDLVGVLTDRGHPVNEPRLGAVHPESGELGEDPIDVAQLPPSPRPRAMDDG